MSNEEESKPNHIYQVYCKDDIKMHAQLSSTPMNINREAETVSVKTQTLDFINAHLTSTTKSIKGDNVFVKTMSFDSTKPIIQYRIRVQATITFSKGFNFFENIPDEVLMIILKETDEWSC